MAYRTGQIASSNDPAEAELLEYASPSRRGPNIWAAAVLAFVGLGLIFLGGCFLIGIMHFHMPQLLTTGAPAVRWTPGKVLFVGVLYMVAGSCFIGAFWILAKTVVGLFKLLTPD